MAEILIYGIVGDDWDGLDAQSIVLALGQSDGDLDVRINSPGGYVMEGLAIVNALNREKAKGRKVTTHIDGLAASMASVIAMVGDEIVMADNALMMIHNPWDCACGDANELRAAADQLDRIRDQLVGIYAKQTGLSAEDLIPLLDAETWMTAEQALEQNFCTAISPAATAAASFVKPFGFRKAPDSPLISPVAMARAQRTAPAAPPNQENPMSGQNQGGGTVTPPATSVIAITAADVQAAVAAERTRVSEIRALGVKHKIEASVIDGLISSDTSVASAREKILDALSERSDTANIGHNAITITADARDKWLDGAANWLMVRAGVAGIVAKAAAARGETLKIDAGEFRGVSCVDLARESLLNAGVRMAARDPKIIVGKAMTARNEITQTTGDFGVLLENVLHKVLQAAYATTTDTWSRVCGIGTINDFRPHNRYLRGTFGALDNLNEAGEFRNKAIPDGAKEQITGKTKGNIIALSRQAIINDDLGVFSGLTVDIGRAAKLTIEVDFYTLLGLNNGLGPIMNDGKTLFHADHANILAGAAPSVVAFDACRVAMARQKDISGNEFLDIRPAAWLGPIELGGTVRTINDALYDPDTVNKLQKPNMVRGLFADIVDTPRLTGAPWYAFADKDTAPAIEVAFLDGVQEPFLESEEGWRVDGTEWKVRLDYAIGGVNYRSASRNPGA
ncbi:ClpP-like prohead protease/major capsid protein fusion protein [Sphingomonas morindae]|uniref:ATP-dependent Clp protease proteolytic subunit n=1 Tax=Sphingomonas morindae TaxID=1541170 RepID=A0ABY4X3Z0_9SPHN|nr:ClpP-like prohead protease/major capsid protein fusion protein [Sphingomonas morindae]USI71622.1 Clp protease ClpP [Sphingomonas morindae]